MREMDLGDLSFDVEEQALLQRMERTSARPMRMRSRPLPILAVGMGIVLTWVGSTGPDGPPAPTDPAHAAGSAVLETVSNSPPPNPADAYVQYNLGIAQLEVNEFDDAITAFTTTIALRPDLAEPYIQRGYSFLRLADYARAIADLTMALRFRPNDAAVYAYRGEAYGRSGDDLQALQDFTAAIRLRPNHGFHYFQRGVAHERLGRYREAFDDYNRALALDPTLQDARGPREGMRKIVVVWDIAKGGAVPKALFRYEDMSLQSPRTNVAVGQLTLIRNGRELYGLFLGQTQALFTGTIDADGRFTLAIARVLSGPDGSAPAVSSLWGSFDLANGAFSTLRWR